MGQDFLEYLLRRLFEQNPGVKLVNFSDPDYDAVVLEIGKGGWKGKWVVRTQGPWGTDYVGDSFTEALKYLNRRK
jgi:hypothetical protein